VVERRLALGLTQFELADLAGVSRAALQRLEAGAPSARLATLEGVAAALGCRVALIDATGSVVGAGDDA
jgi:transcriptional regulator with XRE-family HTH domain